MERIIRQFILFQGCAIGILTILNSLVTLYEYVIDYDDAYMWDYYNDLHGMQAIIIPRELCWFAAACALLYGIHRQDIRFFYPIICVAILALVIQFAREIILFWTNNHPYVFWHYSLFMNPILIFSMACRRIHGTMTLIALKRLFESEQSAGNNFVRFNTERESCEANEAS